MSREGAAATGPVAGADALRVAIVAASWWPEVTDGLIDGARRALAESGLDHPHLLRVPGTFELPVTAARLAKTGKYDAIIALGVVVRGGTPHFDYVCTAATTGLTEVAVRTGIPIGFGVLTCDDEAQALDRSGRPGAEEDKGYEAAHAAVSTAVVLHGL